MRRSRNWIAGWQTLGIFLYGFGVAQTLLLAGVLAERTALAQGLGPACSFTPRACVRAIEPSSVITGEDYACLMDVQDHNRQQDYCQSQVRDRYQSAFGFLCPYDPWPPEEQSKCLNEEYAACFSSGSEELQRLVQRAIGGWDGFVRQTCNVSARGPAEIKRCRDYWSAQIHILDPWVVIRLVLPDEYQEFETQCRGMADQTCKDRGRQKWDDYTLAFGPIYQQFLHDSTSCCKPFNSSYCGSGTGGGSQSSDQQPQSF